MSDTQQNNPAGRVLAILTKVKETQARTVADGFVSVFGIDVADNYGGLYHCLGSLSDSINSIEGRLEQTGNSHFVPYFKKRLPSLRRIFTFQGTSLAWDAFKQSFIHEPDLATLE